MDKEFKKEIILDNYQNPFNKDGDDSLGYEKVNSNSESCIDDIDLYVKVEDGIVKDIHFNGEACAISTSATSIMIKWLKKKNMMKIC